MSEREDWINLIRNEYDPNPDLGRGSYPAFDSEWDDGAGRIADAILADKAILLRRHDLQADEFLNYHRQQIAELLAEIERLRSGHPMGEDA